MTTLITLESIAKKHLGLDSLRAQNSDRADFHELAVWSVLAALNAAFEAGQKAAQSGSEGGAA